MNKIKCTRIGDIFVGHEDVRQGTYALSDEDLATSIDIILKTEKKTIIVFFKIDDVIKIDNCY